VIAGKRLPVVFHVGARALTSQALNIHAGHDDVMGVADTGWGILFARNAQEAADLTAIARRAAEASETPFLVVQDGFLTTHTLENALLPEDELLRDFVGDPADRLRPYFEPADALMTGVVQNQDSYISLQRRTCSGAASQAEVAFDRAMPGPLFRRAVKRAWTSRVLLPIGELDPALPPATARRCLRR
jgi:pyruvate/2-oxoacid:ferredoxin oxidoreductase alpha subunit